MLIDTHCHINIMIKKEFDIPLKHEDFNKAAEIIKESDENSVNILLNVGTSLPESLNSIALAQQFKTYMPLLEFILAISTLNGSKI